MTRTSLTLHHLSERASKARRELFVQPEAWSRDQCCTLEVAGSHALLLCMAVDELQQAGLARASRRPYQDTAM